MATRSEDIDVRAVPVERHEEVLTTEALALVGHLHEELDDTRRALLDERQERQAELDAGGTLDFVSAPEDFTVAPVPDALQDRRVEITGPTSRKMVINALNSGARGFMADFEDANSPTWRNMVGGQVSAARWSTRRGASSTGSRMSTPCCSCARAGCTCRRATCT
jgi:malate synthase